MNSIKQTMVYARKFYRTQKNDVVKALIMGVVIATLVAWITGADMFTTYESTKSGFFSIVSACIWIGIFNSIQLVCREKDNIVKDELTKGIRASSYMAAHFVFQLFVCLIQSVIILAVCMIMIDFPKTGVVFPHSFAEYFITIFLLLYSSDALALVISSYASTPVVAMTVMPFVLIIQLLMSGVLFDLSGFAEWIAVFTVSKWGMEAMGSIGNLNSADLPSSVAQKFPELMFPQREAESIYSATAGHLGKVWLILLLFIVVSYALSSILLKVTASAVSK